MKNKKMKNFIIILITFLIMVFLTLSGCVDKNITKDNIDNDTIAKGEDVVSDNITNVTSGQVDITSDSEYDNSSTLYQKQGDIIENES